MFGTFRQTPLRTQTRKDNILPFRKATTLREFSPAEIRNANAENLSRVSRIENDAHRHAEDVARAKRLNNDRLVSGAIAFFTAYTVERNKGFLNGYCGMDFTLDDRSEKEIIHDVLAQLSPLVK